MDFWEIHKGQVSPHNVVRSYRIWVPLNAIGAGAFASAMQAAHPENVMIVPDARAFKRAKTFTEKQSPLTIIKTAEDLARSLRLYFEGRELIGTILIKCKSLLRLL